MSSSVGPIPLLQEFHDRIAAGKGIAQVAANRPAEPGNIALMPWVVQSKAFTRSFYLLRGHLQHRSFAQKHGQRIARRQRVERIDDHGNSEEDRN